MTKEIDKFGKRVIDISQLVDVFEVQEGEIQHIIGKTGNGKTYEGTRRAMEFLRQGYTVYTTWQLILPEYYDERLDKSKLFWNTIFFKKRFYRFNLKNNWHFLDIDRPDLVEFIAGLTDCIVFLDEGQDIFDSYEGIGMTKIKRKSLTRTRHLRKTLIIISQRAQAVHVTARANITYYYKCVKTTAWFWPFTNHFKVYRTEEMDNSNLPVWEDLITGWQAEVWQSHFARKYIYDSFNSWYLRAGIPKSQDISFEAYDLNLWEKIVLFFRWNKDKKVTLSEQDQAELAEKNLKKFKELTTIDIKPKKRSLKALIPILSTDEPIKIPVKCLEVNNVVKLKHEV